jgi:hypothetical protein
MHATVSHATVHRRLHQYSIQCCDVAWAQLHDAVRRTPLFWLWKLRVKAKLSLRLIKRNAMKTYGGVEIWVHALLHIKLAQAVMFLTLRLVRISVGIPITSAEILHGFYQALQTNAGIVLSRVRVSLSGVLDWRLDLLTTYKHDTQLEAVTAPPLISTIH